jgi:hypothetical protein
VKILSIAHNKRRVKLTERNIKGKQDLLRIAALAFTSFEAVEKLIFCGLIKNARMQGARNPEE